MRKNFRKSRKRTRFYQFLFSKVRGSSVFSSQCSRFSRLCRAFFYSNSLKLRKCFSFSNVCACAVCAFSDSRLGAPTLPLKAKRYSALLQAVPFDPQRFALPPRTWLFTDRKFKGIPSGNPLFFLIRDFPKIAKKPRFGHYRKLWKKKAYARGVPTPAPPKNHFCADIKWTKSYGKFADLFSVSRVLWPSHHC